MFLFATIQCCLSRIMIPSRGFGLVVIVGAMIYTSQSSLLHNFHSILFEHILTAEDACTIACAFSLSDGVVCLSFELVEAIYVEFSSTPIWIFIKAFKSSSFRFTTSSINATAALAGKICMRPRKKLTRTKTNDVAEYDYFCTPSHLSHIYLTQLRTISCLSWNTMLVGKRL